MIVIPMAGESSRFSNAGYSVPKYMLPIENKSVFLHSVSSFSKYYDQDLFVFIFKGDSARSFISHELKKIPLKNYILVDVESKTEGQADTVYRGISKLPPDECLTIFNIDTFRNNFVHPAYLAEVDGYLEVFNGIGDHWSFVKPASGHVVEYTTEKVRVSDLCSNGLYYFKSKSIFDHAFECMVSLDKRTNGEYYIAPMYNQLINDNLNVKYRLVDIADMQFCGTPAEYEACKSKSDLFKTRVI